jgi:N-acetyl-anhydromuramyl-L-alanine amidase AmpD
MTYDITWRGGPVTNSSDRGKNVPCLIVGHISAGTFDSLDSWFTSAGNKTSSAHFGVSRDGRIHQYVDIRRMAWANGIAAADIVRSNTAAVKERPGINPNLYSVSIEHEGYNVLDAVGRIVEKRGLDGDLTDAQFSASAWLHRYIRDEIVRIYGEAARFELDEYHVIGHGQVSPYKPACPGALFPWARLYAELRKENEVSGDESEVGAMKMETWQWAMLAQALDGLYRAGKIGDYAWVEKAYEGELTAAELTWLNTIVFARSNGVDV